MTGLFVGNHPIPPRQVDPAIAPELQEIIYRAMERDPAKGYPTAREFIHDLEHQDQVGVADREELRESKVRKAGFGRKIPKYAGLILIPILLFTLLLWVARKA